MEREKVEKIILGYFEGKLENVAPHHMLIDDLQMDSLQFIGFITYLEESFEIDLDPDTSVRIVEGTIADVISIIEREISGRVL